jgi:hypothetical protein
MTSQPELRYISHKQLRDLCRLFKIKKFYTLNKIQMIEVLTENFKFKSESAMLDETWTESQKVIPEFFHQKKIC